MNRKTLIRITLLCLVCLSMSAVLLRQPFWRSLSAAQRPVQNKENFDIRANLQRTLADPADAEIKRPLATTESDNRSNVRRSTLSYAVRRAHPSVQMKWSSLTQAPSRLWTYSELLSPPSSDDAEVIARRFLRNNEDLLRLSSQDISALQVTRRYQDSHNGLTHVTLQQQSSGIEVFNADLSLHLARTGEIVALSGEALPGVEQLVNAREPALPAAKALRLAAEEAGATLSGNLLLKTQPSGADQKQLFDRRAGFSNDVQARLVYFPLSATQVRLAWEFTLWLQETPDVYLSLIDAEKGTLLYRYNFTCYDENPLKPHGPVFTKDAPLASVPFTTSTPTLNQREDLPFRPAPFNGSDLFPASDPHYDWWNGKAGNNLISNNTDTHLDRDNTPNQPDLPRLEAADGNFSFALDFTKQPTDADYQKAAQVNLFYWINRYHDILYSFGFTEAAGNFQTENFGKGGRGLDPVQGDVQDASGTNNANFSTLPDGSTGRVQMFLWTFTNPQRDGDFDQGIIVHELTHGLSNRLVGNATGLSGVQSRGMGEGWSDYFGLVLLRTEADNLNGRYAVGQYVVNDFEFGIRRFPYSTSNTVFPLTFKDINLSNEVHDEGEIWCNTLLEMRALLIERYGYKEGQRQAIQLVVDGLKLTPRAPSFLDARNAILLADRVNNAGANQCLLWQAFSKRGMGFDAETPDASDGAPVESLVNAPFCNTLGTLRTNKPNYVSGETIQLNLGDANASGTLGVTATSSITGDRETILLQADRNQRGNYTGQLRLTSGRAQIGDGLLQGSVEAGDEIVLTYTDAFTGASFGTPVVLRLPFVREKALLEDDVEAGNQGWLAGGSWSIINSRGATPLRSWTDSPAGTYANSTDVSLVSPQFDLSGMSNVTLSFAHSYDVEDGFDYASIEVSTDDGRAWRRVAATTGSQNFFSQAVVPLRALDNQPRARFRFRLTSDTSVVGDGWYLDDLRLTARSASPAVIAPGTTLDPRLVSLTPAFGPPAGNNLVTLAGANFTETADTMVTFDGTPALLSVVSSNVLIVQAPAHRPGAVTVRVSNRNGTVLLPNAYTYFTSGTSTVRPEIEGVAPDFGSIRGGTLVTVTGKNFTPETTASFSGRAGRTTFVNATTLRVVSPFADAVGRADVTVTTGTLSHNRPSAFNYINPTPPTVDVIAPEGGETILAGSVVTIRWNATDNNALATQRLSLFRPGTPGLQFVRDLATDLTGNVRSFNWPVPFNLPNGEYRFRVTAIDDEGSETEAYSDGGFLLARRWESLPSLPLTTLSRETAAADNRYVYVIGGRNSATPDAATTTVYRLDPSGGTLAWTTVAPIPVGLANADAVFLDGKIYVPGGTNASNLSASNHLVYDTAANTWSTAANAPLANTFYALAADPARGVFYSTGGNSSLSAVRVYTVATNTWSNLPSMPTGRTQHEAALIDGKLYVAGGLNNSGGLTSVEVFDFETRRWSALAPLNEPRAFFAANTVLRDTAGNPYWLLLGGQQTNTGAVLGPEIYDVRNNRWIMLDNSFNLGTPRVVYGHATVGGYLYAIGGATPTIVPLCERLRVDSPFTLIPFNTALPVLVAPATVTALTGVETQFEVFANDLSGAAPLTLTASGLPPTARFETVTNSNNSTRGKFRWTPAAADAGRTVALSFTTSDGLNSETKLVNVRVLTPRPLAAANAADFRAGTLAPDSIASLFGSEFAPRNATSTELPLSSELEGTSVTVNGVRAQLLFVSPTQINFVVPAVLTPGPATVVVSNAAGVYSASTVQIAAVTPALFTRDQSGRGEAYALATDGARFQTPPFDVLVNGRPNVLVLFGTGFRRAQAINPNDENGVAEAVTATIDGRPARVLFAGAQGDLAGFDQLNVELPASLAGGGARSVEIILTVNGETANRVTIPLK